MNKIRIYQKIAQTLSLIQDYCADIRDIDDAILNINYDNKYLSNVKLDTENSTGQKLTFTGHYTNSKFMKGDKERDFIAIVKPDLSYEISVTIKANDGKRMDVCTRENIRLAFALTLIDTYNGT